VRRCRAEPTLAGRRPLGQQARRCRRAGPRARHHLAPLACPGPAPRGPDDEL